MRAVKYVAEIKIVPMYIPTEGGVCVAWNSRDTSGLKHKPDT